MKVIKTYIISEKDKKLLNTPLPDNPCNSCKHYHCMGNNTCSDRKRYQAAVASYDDSGILNYAEKLRDIRHINAEIDTLINKVRKIIADIPHDITEVINDDIYGWPKNVFGEDINNV